jgi:methyltransferase (TIGR00027 family)
MMGDPGTGVGGDVLPDSTAVFTAVWRALHVRRDPPPHVLEDELGLRMADCAETLTGLGYALSDEGGARWIDLPPFGGPLADLLRPLMVGRARFVEDVLLSLVEAEGIDQYVILGAGLDSFALRHPDLADGLAVYEIDQPGPQQWKQQRLAQLGFELPKGLRFVPVDFEAGESWTQRLAGAGFDGRRPAVFCSLGLSQYLSREATAAIFAETAALARGTTLVSSFAVPAHLIAPDEAELTARIKEICAARGCPWVAEYAPLEFEALARQAGFGQVHYQSTAATSERYFSGRGDGLKMPTVEHLLVAR